MTRSDLPVKARQRRATVLAGIILLQALCALFFIGDVVADFLDNGRVEDLHIGLEALAAVALIGGVVFLMIELRRMLARMRDMDAGLQVARGQMAGVMEGFFEAWSLTDAERDVAMMILKGLDNEAIAQVRNTAPGTVRAQAASIYAKSGTHGRAQFVSLFVEELMSGDFGAAGGAEGVPAAGAGAVGGLRG